VVYRRVRWLATVYTKKEKEIPTLEQLQFTVYNDVCMQNSSFVYPTLAIERLNTIMLTLYSDEVEELWRELVLKRYENATSEDELRQILKIGCDIMFIVMNASGEDVKSLVTKILNSTRKKHLFYVNEEALVAESSYLIDVLTKFVNPNGFDVLTVLSILKDVQIRTATMISSIKGTSLYQTLVSELGIDENIIEKKCTAKYYRECVTEKKTQLLKALQFIRMNINIPR